MKKYNDGATIVQGAIIQGNNCPRDSSPRRQFSKETIVQGDLSLGELSPWIFIRWTIVAPPRVPETQKSAQGKGTNRKGR